MPSGWWIRLNDVRVRIDLGDGDPNEVIRALLNLYEGAGINDDFESEEYE